ncbi:MAG TPA: DHH family phosphoesterase [Desulfitobacteriaceae bacterium]|nr:DHH family phosphoesterase [Desulfitobacteriaceae bacterium]
MIYVFGHNYPYTDLDSVVSSVAFAYLLEATGRPARAVLLNPNALKSDVIGVLGKLEGFVLPLLVTKSELMAGELALVDHNEPRQSYGFLGISKIPLYCIDHRTDSGLTAVEKQIEIVGATSTLVAERIKKAGVKLTPILAKALVYAISSDTRGLKIKTNQRDLVVIAYLYSTYAIDVPLLIVQQQTVTAQDVTSMSVEKILASNLKEYQEGRIAVAMLDVANDEDYAERLDEILQRARKDQCYGLYVLMINHLHRDATTVYYIDNYFGCFPEQENYDCLISRSHDLIPAILRKIDSVSPCIKGSVCRLENCEQINLNETMTAYEEEGKG